MILEQISMTIISGNYFHVYFWRTFGPDEKKEKKKKKKEKRKKDKKKRKKILK